MASRHIIVHEPVGRKKKLKFKKLKTNAHSKIFMNEDGIVFEVISLQKL